MLEEEESIPTFEHPPNWNQLEKQEKADIVSKLSCMSDFSSHYFKEAISQNAVVVEQQENEISQSDKEAISIMGSISLDNVKYMELGTRKN